MFKNRLQKFLIVFSLFLMVVVPLCAGQNYNFGFAFADIPTFKPCIGASAEYVSTPDFRYSQPPVTMAYGARGDFAVAGLDIDGMMLSLITGGGTKVYANENLSVTLYAGPSFLFYMGNGKNGSLEADTGLGVGMAGNVAYSFSNPGFVLKTGVWANCALVLTNTRPFAFGADISVGVTY